MTVIIDGSLQRDLAQGAKMCRFISHSVCSLSCWLCNEALYWLNAAHCYYSSLQCKGMEMFNIFAEVFFLFVLS